jgi:heme exporter protein A
MIKACNLVAQRNEVSIFENINFAVNSGHCLQIVGANGSGKTTLLKVIAGIIPYTGTITTDAPVIYCGHRNCLHLELDALQNLEFLLSLYDKPTTREITNTLALVNMSAYIGHPCHELSAGQLQRIMLAYLMLTKVSIWLLDEPTTNLDDRALLLFNTICTEHLQRGGAIIIATHLDMTFKTATLQMDNND